MAKQIVKYGLNSLIVIISFCLILAVINFFSYRHFKRLDITAEKAYTITNSTKKILSRLKDDIRLKVYISEKLPPNLMLVKRDIVDLLEEYHIYSKGKIKIEFVDPTDNQELENKLMMQGIQKIPVTILEKEKLESTAVYLSLIVEYLDKSEVIPIIQADTIEYDLSSAIMKVLSDKERTLGILFNPAEDEKEYEENYYVLQEYLRKNYRLMKLDSKGIEYSLKNLDTLIVFSQKDFTERELYLIDQFILHGGKLIALVDTVKFGKGTMMPSKQSSNFVKLLENYGVKVNEDLVFEYDQRGRAMASFNMGYMALTLPYPFYIKILPIGYDKKHPVVTRLSDVVMPWPSSISFSENLPSDVEKSEIIKTTPTADHQTDNFDINPQKRYAPAKKEDMKQFTLAAVVSGNFSSFFKDKEIPKAETVEGAPPREDNTPKIDKSEKPTQILVVGNTRFAEDRRCYQQTYGGLAVGDNGKLLLNAIDWMTMGEELITIRTRQVEARPLKELSDSQRTAYRFLGTFGISLIVVILGILRIFIKRAKRRKQEIMYTSVS